MRPPATEDPTARTEPGLDHAQLAAAVFEQSDTGIVVLDERGVCVHCNPAFPRLLGYSREELVGLALADLVADRHDSCREEWRLFRERTAGERHELTLRRKNGTPVRVEYRALPHGHLGYHVALVRDTSALQRAEQSASLARRRFEALVEGSTDIIALVAADGTVAYHSPALTAILGYNPEERDGRNALDHIHSEDLTAVRAALERIAAAPGRQEKLECRIRHREGGWRWLEIQGVNRLHDPAIAGLVVNGRDVTERRHLEGQLAQAQKMEAIGRLAGGIAHDFNNLLTAITGYSELAAEALDEEAAAHGDLLEIRRAAQRAAQLTRQLLTFSRQQVVQLRPLELDAVVADAMGMVTRLIGEDIRIELEMGAPGCRVMADGAQLQQVLLNLCLNSRDAMPGGGRLRVATGRQVLSPNGGAEALAGGTAREGLFLQVTDEGVGMSEEVRRRAFEPFYTTKPFGKGTGLGLSTIYGIAQQCGGGVALESQPGKGTAVTLTLPLASVEEAGPDPGAAGPRESAVRRGTILLAEDDPQVATAAAAMLHRAGFTILTAANGAEAAVLAQRHAGTVDLLITDVVMPGMSGPELARRLHGTAAALPVLYMSGYAEEMLGPGALGGADVHFLQKPFTKRGLLEAVEAALV
jgi:two-component system, cell cycle sensor histidine kinase and response regulator CckA